MRVCLCVHMDVVARRLRCLSSGDIHLFGFAALGVGWGRMLFIRSVTSLILGK